MEHGKATVAISPTRRHRGNLVALRWTREVTAIPAKFAVFPFELGAMRYALLVWENLSVVSRVGDLSAFRLFIDSQDAQRLSPEPFISCRGYQRKKRFVYNKITEEDTMRK